LLSAGFCFAYNQLLAIELYFFCPLKKQLPKKGIFVVLIFLFYRFFLLDLGIFFQMSSENLNTHFYRTKNYLKNFPNSLDTDFKNVYYRH